MRLSDTEQYSLDGAAPEVCLPGCVACWTECLAGWQSVVLLAGELILDYELLVRMRCVCVRSLSVSDRLLWLSLSVCCLSGSVTIAFSIAETMKKVTIDKAV